LTPPASGQLLLLVRQPFQFVVEFGQFLLPVLLTAGCLVRDEQRHEVMRPLVLLAAGEGELRVGEDAVEVVVVGHRDVVGLVLVTAGASTAGWLGYRPAGFVPPT
jgi:hypothetical protein